VNQRNSIDRRRLLKGSGVAVALPWLEAMNTNAFAAVPAAGDEPRRIVLINLNLGLYAPALFPLEQGRDFEPSEYLQQLNEFRNQYTVISGLSHPEVVGGHATEARIFNGTPSSQKMGISLDQYAAKFLGEFTRFDTLPLGMGNTNLSWAADGSPVPAESRMAVVFQRLFADESVTSKQAARKVIDRSGSILDLIHGQAKRLEPRISKADQEKMKEFFSSVRETERRLAKSESWLDTPKPSVNVEPPMDPTSRSAFVLRMKNLFDVAYLALKTDTTRIITFNIFEQNSVTVAGVNNGYHNLSHHGKDPSNIGELKLIESAIFEQLASFLSRLKQTQEQDSTLLDQTTVLVTSNLGNASNHSNKNLPVLLAGGRFNHGQHLVFDPPNTNPLCNVFVSMLQQLGIETDGFGTSNGTLTGLS